MKAAIVRYRPILVIDKLILANNGVSILNRFLISNWSKGLNIVWYINIYKYNVLLQV